MGRSPAPVLAEPDSGCLFLSDVSGYTEYLVESELEHAQDVLADLTRIVVEALRPVLRVSKLEGDAVFAYALAGAFGASTLLDVVEQTYFAFRSRLRDIDHATSCRCKACALMPTLDLKFVVHDGRFVRRDHGQGEELTGPDVIVVHRLLKNDAAEALDSRGYALYTDACVRALGLEPEPLGLRRHAETYDGIGEVRCWLEDLDGRWRAELERRRVYVEPGETVFELSGTLPVAPPVAWDWLTDPAKRDLWQGWVTERRTPGGRTQSGVTNHCMHGADMFVEEIADWRPFDYYTLRYPYSESAALLVTTELEPEGAGTTVTARGALVGPEAPAIWAAIGEETSAGIARGGRALAELLAERVARAGGPTAR